MKASVIIANFNNEKFIDECINSLNSQTYKNIEIIFFDDSSSDNSIKKIEKFQNVKLIKNYDKTNFSTFNQMNAFKKAIDLSTGDIIFFLDSDDFFHEKKVEKVIDFFSKEKDKMIIFDFPIILKKDKKIKQKKINKFFKTYWDYIHPTSCISIRKSIADKIFDNIFNYKFSNTWMDFRIHLYSKYLNNNFTVLNENLTYYRRHENSITIKFTKISKEWWIRRAEAHDYLRFFAEKNDLNIKKNYDFIITKLLYKLIK